MELYRGDMSWRELRVFLRYLPSESATAIAVRGRTPEEEHWTADRQLMASVVDHVSFLNALTLYVNSDPKRRGRFKPPDPIERPGVQKRQKSNVIRFGGRHGSGAAQLATVFGGATSS